MTYYIFRHGLATKSKSGYGAHIMSAKLLPEAIPPIKKLAEYLKGKPTDFNVSSEYIRCRETAEIVSEITSKQFVFDKRLNEYFDLSFEEFLKRITSFLTDLEKKQYKSVVICSHAAVITILLKLIKKESLRENDTITNYPLPGVLLIVENNTVKEINFNT